jgi:hypothetical protein
VSRTGPPVDVNRTTISMTAPHPSLAEPREPREAELPDIEGSTRLWETESAAMTLSLSLHNETLHAAFEHHGGALVSAMGDGIAVAFSSAVGAVRAALEAQ